MRTRLSEQLSGFAKAALRRPESPFSRLYCNWAESRVVQDDARVHHAVQRRWHESCFDGDMGTRLGGVLCP
jgi:hypothetical protein